MLSRVLIKNGKGNYVQFNTSASEDQSARPYERIRPLPPTIGKGHFSSFALDEGLGVGVCRGRFDREYNARFTSKGPLFYFVFGLKGHALTWNSCRPDPVVMAPNRSSVYFFGDPDSERKISGRQDVLSLVIHVSPDFLRKLLDPGHRWDARHEVGLESILNDGHFHSDDLMTAQMKTAFFQIVNNPHQGRIGRIYLESKALELIALKLEQVFQETRCETDNPPLSPEERERIYHARDMLIGRLQYPPSLRELAGQVGMSHARLSREFKKFFGCTVFEFLRRERLSYARMLIEEKPADLTWVAFESGFCSSSHFAASFLKAYGIRPSEYRKSLSMANAVNKA
jgi:AraC family transcriptional regulator, transcriptional activator of the genes for pyochelin and ferripyochelin receptors